MSGAGAALQTALLPRIGAIAGLSGVYPGAPLQAVVPYAMVDCGGEIDWGHKSGVGREVRVGIALRDSGERPARLQALVAEAEAALEPPLEVDGWALVSFAWLRSRIAREGRGEEARWAGLIEYRARLLRAPELG
jgi:hypothetical protein